MLLYQQNALRVTAILFLGGIHSLQPLSVSAQQEASPSDVARERLSTTGVRFDVEYLTPQNLVRDGEKNGVPVFRPQASLHAVVDGKWNGVPADLEDLKLVDGLLSVELRGSKIVDSHVAQVAKCKTIQKLRLIDSRVTDIGMQQLSKLPELNTLDIRFTPISIKALPSIAACENLLQITLLGTEIPHAETEQLVNRLRKGSHVYIGSGAFLGVGRLPSSNESEGCGIGRPQPNSAAENAGLIQGDVIKQFGETDIRSFDDLTKATRDCKPGQTVIVIVERKGEEFKKDIQLGKWPER